MKMYWQIVIGALIGAFLGLTILHGLVTVFGADTPTISVNDKSTVFIVAFKPGAVEACTVYQSEKDTIIQQNEKGEAKTVPYAPRHCWFFGKTLTGYTDDWAFIKPDGGTWKVWAEVYYDKPDGSISTEKTNVLAVKR